jgi:hypothetical protein
MLKTIIIITAYIKNPTDTNARVKSHHSDIIKDAS